MDTSRGPTKRTAEALGLDQGLAIGTGVVFQRSFQSSSWRASLLAPTVTGSGLWNPSEDATQPDSPASQGLHPMSVAFSQQLAGKVPN